MRDMQTLMRAAVLAAVIPLGITLAQAKSSEPAADAVDAKSAYDPKIVSTLLNLLNAQTPTHPSQADFSAQSLQDLLATGTPEGFLLRTRYLNLGIPLSQDLAVAEDKRRRSQLIEAARWESTPEIRAVALIALAEKQDPNSKKYFREALNNPKPEVRFMALEALQIWNQPESVELYKYAVKSDPAPLLQVYAAQALAKAGDPEGLEVLRKHVGDGDWLTSAMACRYIGDFGTGDDYDLVLDRMTQGQTINNFVKAEAAIAALKLFPKKQQ
jgi:HEAT repeat protein